MRIARLRLGWFRGASHDARLECESKSVVVYGANGSGKSSFADALEYIITKGRISHLRHEYSGAKQEKGVRNTHIPEGEQCRVHVEFEDDSSVGVSIGPDGTALIEGTPPDTVAKAQSWALERTILRQDELASFIHSTKGQKYSVLLPLLGLSPLEHAAENLHRLRDTIEKRANLDKKRQRLADLREEALQHLPDVSAKAVETSLEDLATRYASGKDFPTSDVLVAHLESAIETSVASSEAELKKHSALQEIAAEEILKQLAAVRRADRAAAKEVSELLDRRIPVLEDTERFVTALEPEIEKIDCPACGRPIEVLKLAEHVRSELQSLRLARNARDAAVASRKSLASSVASITRRTRDPAVANWLGRAKQKALARAIDGLANMGLATIERWVSSTLKDFKRHAEVVDKSVAQAIRRSRPSTKRLFEDSRVVAACRKLPEIRGLERDIRRTASVLRGLESAETTVRQHIRERAAAIIGAISDTVQQIWGKLHPDEPISDVRLYFAEGDKAIDVALNFFGVDQPSPRLTLSEGHRNSLGLCIFLAMVLQEAGQGRPIVLDDVVSSFDREHRGMLVDVLIDELADRQVLLLTHERQWYAELRRRLRANEWSFGSLRP